MIAIYPYNFKGITKGISYYDGMGQYGVVWGSMGQYDWNRICVYYLYRRVDTSGICRAHCRTDFWISGLMLDIYVVNFVPKFLRTDDRTDYWTVFGLILPSGSAQLYAVLQGRS